MHNKNTNALSAFVLFVIIASFSCKTKAQVDQNTFVYPPEIKATVEANKSYAEHYSPYIAKCKDGYEMVQNYGGYNNKECIKCPDVINGKKVIFDGYYWCVWCSEGGSYYRDSAIQCDTALGCGNQNKCEWCENGYTFGIYNGTKSCIKCNSKTKHRPSKYFKPNTPKYIKYNGKNWCVDCANGYNFDKNQGKCIQCGKGETFDDMFSKCIKRFLKLRNKGRSI